MDCRQKSVNRVRRMRALFAARVPLAVDWHRNKLSHKSLFCVSKLKILYSQSHGIQPAQKILMTPRN
jgi:hypothetical protein